MSFIKKAKVVHVFPLFLNSLPQKKMWSTSSGVCTDTKFFKKKKIKKSLYKLCSHTIPQLEFCIFPFPIRLICFVKKKGVFPSTAFWLKGRGGGGDRSWKR